MTVSALLFLVRTMSGLLSAIPEVEGRPGRPVAFVDDGRVIVPFGHAGDPAAYTWSERRQNVGQRHLALHSSLPGLADA